MSFVGPIAVAIVVYGEKTPQGRKFEELTSNGEVDAYGPIDVRTILKFDPLLSKKREYKVKHTDNGDMVNTQLSMFNDKRFYTAVKGITEMVQAYADQEGFTDESTFNVAETEQTHRGLSAIVGVKCTAGQHRSDTGSAAAAKLVLNQITFGGSRKFNVNVFRLNEAHDCTQMLKNAGAWLKKPWMCVDPEPNYAEHVCKSSPVAAKTWNAICELVQAYDGNRCGIIDATTREMLEVL